MAVDNSNDSAQSCTISHEYSNSTRPYAKAKFESPSPVLTCSTLQPDEVNSFIQTEEEEKNEKQEYNDEEDDGGLQITNHMVGEQIKKRKLTERVSMDGNKRIRLDKKGVKIAVKIKKEEMKERARAEKEELREKGKEKRKEQKHKLMDLMHQAKNLISKQEQLEIRIEEEISSSEKITKYENTSQKFSKSYEIGTDDRAIIEEEEELNKEVQIQLEDIDTDANIGYQRSRKMSIGMDYQNFLKDKLSRGRSHSMFDETNAYQKAYMTSESYIANKCVNLNKVSPYSTPESEKKITELRYNTVAHGLLIADSRKSVMKEQIQSLQKDESMSPSLQSNEAEQDTEAFAYHYHDYSTWKPSSTEKISKKALMKFPQKLYQMFSVPNQERIMTWLPNGRAFKIIDHTAFVKKVLPLYFRSSKLLSFKRQLRLYGFRRINHNQYYHEMFLRGMPHLCDVMKPISKEDTNKLKTEDKQKVLKVFHKLSKEYPALKEEMTSGNNNISIVTKQLSNCPKDVTHTQKLLLPETTNLECKAKEHLSRDDDKQPTTEERYFALDQSLKLGNRCIALKEKRASSSFSNNNDSTMPFTTFEERINNLEFKNRVNTKALSIPTTLRAEITALLAMKQLSCIPVTQVPYTRDVNGSKQFENFSSQYV